MEWKDQITVQELVDFLNSLLEIDRSAITHLFSMRTACNHDLTEHPTVQVGSLSKDYWQIGIIGILNGAFGITPEGWGRIGAQMDNGVITHFKVLSDEDIKGFCQKSACRAAR